MTQHSTALFVLCLAAFCGTAQGEVWDARGDFIGGLDQFEEPNEPWSYRCGEPGRGAYGDYLVWKNTPQRGQPGGI